METAVQGSGLEAWVNADKEKRSVKIEQLTEEGKPFTIETYTYGEGDVLTKGTTSVIEPKSSPKMTDYFEADKAGAIKRYNEYYIIRYTIREGTNEYTVDRKVKLRYQTGDLDGDGEVSLEDGLKAKLVYAGAYSTFIEKDGMTDEQKQAVIEMNVDTGDFDGDGEIGMSDGSDIALYYGGAADYPDMRW